MAKRPWRLGAVTLLLLVAFALRAHHLNKPSLWTDEGGTVFATRQAWRDTVDYLLDDAVHPPLFFFVQKAAFAFGESEYVMRWPAMIFGLLGVAVVARVGSEWMGFEAGVLAALLTAVSPFAVLYSREVRMYSLLMLLVTSAMWSFSRLIAGSARVAVRAGFALISSALYLTHYFGLLTPLVQFAFLVLTFQRHYRHLRWWVVSQVVAAVPVGLWLIVQYAHGVTLKIAWIQPPQWTDLPRTLMQFAGGDGGGWLWRVAALCVVMAALGVWARRASARSSLLVMWMLLPPLVTYAVSLRRPLYVDRYMIGSLPALMLATSAGMLFVFRRLRLAGVILLATMIGVFAWRSTQLWDRSVENWRDAVSFITADERDTDVLVRRSVYYRAMDYYYHGKLQLQSTDAEWRAESPSALIGRRLWFVYVPSTDGYEDKEALLEDLYSHAQDVDSLNWLKEIEPFLHQWRNFDGVTVMVYDFSSAP